MSEPQDIRQWATQNGIELAARGRIPVAVKEQYEARDEPPPDEGDVIDVTFPDAEPKTAGPPPAADATPEPVQERKPQPPPRKRRGMFQRKPAGPKLQRRRVSIENVVGSLWGLGGMALMRNPKSVPVGIICQYQAPVAGIIVEDIAKGTVVDKLLQPLARAGEKGEIAMALFGPPVLTAAITAKPELYPVLKPMLKMSLMSWVQIAGPAKAKLDRKIARYAEDMGSLAEIDALIDSLWNGPDWPVQPSQQEEDNIRRARGE